MQKNLLRNLRAAWKSPRWRGALLTAVLSDALGFAAALYPPAQWALDAVTAVVLFAVLGIAVPYKTYKYFEAKQDAAATSVLDEEL